MKEKKLEFYKAVTTGSESENNPMEERVPMDLWSL